MKITNWIKEFIIMSMFINSCSFLYKMLFRFINVKSGNDLNIFYKCFFFSLLYSKSFLIVI